MSWKRQLDFYAYLLKLNNYEVSNKAHWLYCNGIKQGNFDNKLQFNLEIQTHKIQTDYIEDQLVALVKCLSGTKIPDFKYNCEHCIRDRQISSL